VVSIPARVVPQPPQEPYPTQPLLCRIEKLTLSFLVVAGGGGRGQAGISQHLFLTTSWNSTVLRYQQALYFCLARPFAN